MIPSTTGFLKQDIEIKEQPGKTYGMDLNGDSVRRYTDGREAVQQAVFRILNTERYRYLIYPLWYGIETTDLYGEPLNWVCAELERRIAEALLTDSRIKSVTDFEHDVRKKGTVHTTFTVNTIYGDVRGEREVSI